MKKLGGIALFGISLVFLAGCGSSTNSPASQQKTALAECLSSKGVVMYGTNRCPHCQKQKALFGDAFEKINFVDCDANDKACSLAGVTGYPTWKFADGTVLQGTQELQVLAEAGSCSYGEEATSGSIVQQETGTGESISSGSVETGSENTLSANQADQLTLSGDSETVSGEVSTGN